MPTSTNDHFTLPWGASDRINLSLPADWPAAEVVEPDLTDPIDDYPAALNSALDAPRGMSLLERHLRPGIKIAIVVDDPSRWTPVTTALGVLLPRLTSLGVNDAEISISVGVGRHHAVDDQAMRARVGNDVVARFRCFSPPVDDISAYVDLGFTPDGVPVRVFRPVAEADLRILIGSVLPHLQAGFGGGYKLIFPGTCHRSTLGSLHRRGLEHGVAANRLLGGDPSTNPMRALIRGAASKLGPCFSISHVLGPNGAVFRVEAGDPDAVQTTLAEAARRRFRAPEAPLADLVVVGNHPWPGDPMQSFKVLLHHRAACRSGGALIGLFWTDPGEIDRSFPLASLQIIARSGRVGSRLIEHGLPAAERFASALKSPAAFMVRWARELVVDRAVLVYAPPLFERLGPRLGPVRIFNDLNALWKAASPFAFTHSLPRVRVFPVGGLTYVEARQ